MKCRHCHSELHLPVLDLETSPPSNAYLTPALLHSPEPWFPLRLMVCEHCWLVQTEDYAGREQLFTEDYAYFSSYSTSWLTHAKNYVDDIIPRLGLSQKSMVVEIAANDGYLLQYFAAAQIPCYGIEPTASTAQAARAKGLEIHEAFFGMAFAKSLAAQDRQADLIVANNVLAHVPDINDFLLGVSRLLKPGGVVTFEFPHLLRMVQGCQFDTAYHEHYSYLSLTALDLIVTKAGLAIFDIDHLPTHGGSLRIYAQRSDAARLPISPAVENARQEEIEAGVQTAAFYRHFQSEALRIKYELLHFLLEAKARGATVGAYGAAAKGNTLLNFAGVRGDLLPFVVDLNPAKQGKYLPGSRIPIVDEAHLKARQPDYILILPWNLRSEIEAQLAYSNQWGARFVTTVPALTVTEAATR